MTQTPMTTREAVKIAIQLLVDNFDDNSHRAAKALCEAYNFKLSDFFDNVTQD